MIGLFTRRVRGFRLLDLTMVGAVIGLGVGVHAAKTVAGRNHQEIARVERDIAAEQRRIRLLKAEVAHLEQPERLGRLSSTYLGLQPVESNKEAPPESLEELARQRVAPTAPSASTVGAPTR